MDKLTAEQVRYRLSYDPETGIFRWRNPNSPSPVKPGVAYNKRRGRFMAYIRHQGRQIHLGYFDDPQSAHHVYVEAATRLFGSFARAA